MVVVKSCDENPELCFHLNVDGAAAWFEAAEKSGVKRFIFASTSHVYAKSESPIGTDHPLAPSTTYGESKLRAELRLQKLAKNSTLQLVIARIFSVLDENSKPGFLLPKLIQRAKQKDYSPIPGLFCFRDFLTSSEVAASLWRLAMAPSPPRVVNICSGRATQIAELARNIFSQYGADPSRLKAADDTSNPYMVGVPTVF
jgi:nucleoside-diphosphate-sugar epimerase